MDHFLMSVLDIVEVIFMLGNGDDLSLDVWWVLVRLYLSVVYNGVDF